MPAEFTQADDLSGARFFRTDLSRAWLVRANMDGAVLRGVFGKVEVDTPWLYDGGFGLIVNGIDVAAYVDAELAKVFPGRELRFSQDADGLRASWSALEQAWQAAIDRVQAMPEGTADASVAGEWSFAQTLRHLVLATDMWLGKAVLGEQQPFHPLGLIDHESAEDEGFDPTLFVKDTPTIADVLEASGERRARVRAFLSDVTPEQLDEARPNPHEPTYQETVRQCLHTVLEESWEHLRYAVRDLDVLEHGSGEQQIADA